MSHSIMCFIYIHIFTSDFLLFIPFIILVSIIVLDSFIFRITIVLIQLTCLSTGSSVFSIGFALATASSNVIIVRHRVLVFLRRMWLHTRFLVFLLFLYDFNVIVVLL
jgi:hypothetical protein